MSPSQPPRSSIPSSLPKRSSGAPYIAAIVVLVLLIVGLVWFKFSRDKEPPAQPPVIQSVTQNDKPPPPPVFDIPAPPVIEAGPDAEPDDDKKKPSGGGVTLCSSPCRGTAPPALRSALSGTAAAARGCYERALRTNSMLQGRMMVAVRIASNGNVCNASIVQDSVGSPQVSSCVIGLFRGKRFPPVTGGRCADVQVPLSFKPREKQ
ncbi:MAG: AgmX/PglI C-terminal domain-containing protein [Myxococcota bacterium]